MPRTVFDPDSPEVNPYALLTSLVIPRAIAWVSTVDSQGRGNLAPHSFFTVASNRPPTVLFCSIGRKDTVTNVEATGEFVVNFSSRELLEAVNATSAPFAHGEDEAAALGIVTEPSETVSPRRARDSPASVECRLDRIVEVGTSYVVLGRVTAITVREDVLVDGGPDSGLLQPVSRLGGDEWGLPPEVFSLARPARPEDVR